MEKVITSVAAALYCSTSWFLKPNIASFKVGSLIIVLSISLKLFDHYSKSNSFLKFPSTLLFWSVWVALAILSSHFILLLSIMAFVTVVIIFTKSFSEPYLKAKFELEHWLFQSSNKVAMLSSTSLIFIQAIFMQYFPENPWTRNIIFALVSCMQAYILLRTLREKAS